MESNPTTSVEGTSDREPSETPSSEPLAQNEHSSSAPEGGERPTEPAGNNKNRLLSRLLVAIGLVVLVASCAISWAKWNDPDRELKVVNFLVAWWPFAVSVFAAFIPDIDKRGKGTVTWRVGIIVLGLAYSLLLWHQQSLLITSARADQKLIVTEAVTKSNEHSDTQISKMREDIQQSTQHADSKIGEVRNDLQKAVQDFTGTMAKSTSSINEHIGKVGKPEPPAPAELRFTLWSEEAQLDKPVLETSLRPDKDGIFTVDFTFYNASTTTARMIDLWVDICTECSFAKEPTGFDRPSGMADTTRHTFVQNLNGGASYLKTSLAIKLSKPFARFPVALRYSCEACGGKMMPSQLAWITVLPASP